MTAVRMFQLQLHTGFLDPYTKSFIMERWAAIIILEH